ncbi:heme-binding protein [Microbacterium sp.]|uniref:GlcG/HbpS family heme-binding protein n=1 Tax=Microbacterium sp. TaxID=51671 RepID=UPI00333F3CD2
MSETRVPSDVAKRLLEEAAVQSARIGVPMGFAIVDTAGHLTSFERLAGAGWVTVGLAQGKARAAVAFGSSTAELAERWAGAPLFATALIAQNSGDLVPAPGGFPIVLDGVVVGAIGASGGTGAQDAAVLQGALDAVTG